MRHPRLWIGISWLIGWKVIGFFLGLIFCLIALGLSLVIMLFAGRAYGGTFFQQAKLWWDKISQPVVH